MVAQHARSQLLPHQSSAGSAIVILGGGIIGFCTAYYLCQSLETGISIIIVDNAPKLFAGASGKANGILGDYGFEPEVEDLGKLSFKLHQQLAGQHQGPTRWGHRNVKIYDCYRENPSEASKTGGARKEHFPRWFNYSDKRLVTQVPDHRHAARM